MSKQTRNPIIDVNEARHAQHVGEVIGRLQIIVQQLESPPQAIQVRRA